MNNIFVYLDFHNTGNPTLNTKKHTVIQHFEYYVSKMCVVTLIEFPTPIIDQVYIVLRPALRFTYQQFTKSYDCPLAQITVTATVNGGAALPSFINFNPITQSFNIYSIDDADAGYYIVTIKAELAPGYQSSPYPQPICETTF